MYKLNFTLVYVGLAIACAAVLLILLYRYSGSRYSLRVRRIWEARKATRATPAGELPTWTLTQPGFPQSRAHLKAQDLTVEQHELVEKVALEWERTLDELIAAARILAP